MSGIDKSDALKWRPVIDEACDYISSHIIKENLTEYDRKRIDVLSAVYAYRIFCMSDTMGVSSFTAGEVKITPSADRAEKAELLWQDYLKESADLICIEQDDEESSESYFPEPDDTVPEKSFLFGAVVI